MNPLAEYLIRKWQESKTIEEQVGYEAALEEMGYWVLGRPVCMKAEEMARVTGCKIYYECDLVLEFESISIPVPGYETPKEEKITVSVFKERGE